LSLDDVEALEQADLMHYSREQRKFIFDHFEKFKLRHEAPSLTWYIQKVYIPSGLANQFHEEFMAKHRAARDYLATVSPKN